MLILDMRSRKDYHDAHLRNSINIGLDVVNDEFFTKFKADAVNELVKGNENKIDAFKNRKRKFIYLIPSQGQVL
jgi:hypothetical protein